MKTIHILLASLLVGVTPVTPAPAQDDTPLRFATGEHDFGTIREEDGSVSHTFEFTNDGPTPVAIDRVVASCGCTTPEYPRTPIAPGGKAHIKATFDPRGMRGDFSKSITVVSGGNKFRNFLTINGKVVPRPPTVEEEFPGDMGGGVRFSTTLLSFRSVEQGGASSMVVSWINTSSEGVALAFVPEPEEEQSGLLVIDAPEALCAGCRGDITFTYDLTERTAYGQRYDVVRPTMNGTPSTKTVYASMTGIDDFSQTDMTLAARFFLDATFHDYGEVRRRAMPYVFRLTASNEGAETLHIRSVTEAEGVRCTLREGMTIAPGDSLPFEVVFYSNRYPAGEVRQSVRIVVNDPMRPSREIRISAIVK